jgi:spermidine synthase
VDRKTAPPLTADEVNLSEAQGVRYLHFGSPWVQGAMRLNRPYALELDYIKDMMAWWLFLQPQAGSAIVQLGLGAASLTKYCLEYCAPAKVGVVELNQRVIQVAQDFFHLPHTHPRLQVFCCDAQDWLKCDRPPAQILQVDLYDAEARGPVYDSLAFYQACRQNLSHPGLLVVNLFGQHQSYSRNLRALGQAFGERVLTLKPTPQGNSVVLAFRGPVLQVSWSALRQRARHLQKKTGLPAMAWVQWLQKQRPGPFFVV